MMYDTDDQLRPADEREQHRDRETEAPLPPVEPPSAGFIVQLFVIPAVIVAAVIGIYLLFGRLATGELDWRQQVENVRSQNPHVRWPGALSLAQMLDADAASGSAQPLARNPEIAAALSELFVETRGLSPRSEETTAQIEFLTKALGRLDAPEIVFPVLLDAAESDADRELRKHALTAVAMSAGSALERNAPYADTALAERVIRLSGNDDPLVRHQAAFILGLLHSPAASARLEVLLQDSDQMTRINAAIGLARQDSTAGWSTFEEVLADAVANPIVPPEVPSEEQAQTYFERTLMLTNCLKAVERLQPQLGPEDRERTSRLLDQVAAATADDKLSLTARELALQLAAPQQ
jgi:hypothetical protein